MKRFTENHDSSRRQFIKKGAVAFSGAALASTWSNANGASAETISPPQAVSGSAKRRVIIDTDPGTDDALAIFLALCSPELRVEALTPVAGNVPLEITLPNALRLLEIAGRADIPVAAGASKPLVRRLITASYAHGENGLGGVQFPEPKVKPVAESASQLIRQIVRKSPGEITIIALGPLTNLAIAFRDDPALAGMVQSIVLMGGSLSRGNVTPSAEFNIYADPEAAQAVFHAGAPITMVGLDVTRKAVLREEHIQAFEAGDNPMSRAAGQITRATMDRIRKAGNNGGPVMHDSLAVAAFLDPTVVTLHDYYIEVETSGEFAAGETLGYNRAPIHRSAPVANSAAAPSELMTFKPNAKVAMELDAERFFKLLVGRITTGSAVRTGND
jgi:inosine-uridine nucleoside N-ribohydrolase